MSARRLAGSFRRTLGRALSFTEAADVRTKQVNEREASRERDLRKVALDDVGSNRLRFRRSMRGIRHPRVHPTGERRRIETKPR